MSVTLKLHFATIQEAQEFIAGKINAAPAAQVSQPARPDSPANHIASEPAAEAAPVAEKPKRGRPKAAQAPAPADTQSAAPQAAAPLDQTAVRAELMKVNDKFGADGLGKVAELLQPFGVQKIADLKPEQFPQVVAAAQTMLGA